MAKKLGPAHPRAMMAWHGAGAWLIFSQAVLQVSVWATFARSAVTALRTFGQPITCALYLTTPLKHELVASRPEQANGFRKDEGSHLSKVE